MSSVQVQVRPGPGPGLHVVVEAPVAAPELKSANKGEVVVAVPVVQTCLLFGSEFVC